MSVVFSEREDRVYANHLQINTRALQLLDHALGEGNCVIKRVGSLRDSTMIAVGHDAETRRLALITGKSKELGTTEDR